MGRIWVRDSRARPSGLRGERLEVRLIEIEQVEKSVRNQIRLDEHRGGSVHSHLERGVAHRFRGGVHLHDRIIQRGEVLAVHGEGSRLEIESLRVGTRFGEHEREIVGRDF